jgi:hypothetical protein
MVLALFTGYTIIIMIIVICFFVLLLLYYLEHLNRIISPSDVRLQLRQGSLGGGKTIIDILENPDQPDRSCLHLGNQESPAPPAPPGRPGDLEDRQVPCREGPPQHPRPSPPRPSFTTFRRWGVTELDEPGWGGLLPLRRYFRPQGVLWASLDGSGRP